MQTNQYPHPGYGVQPRQQAASTPRKVRAPAQMSRAPFRKSSIDARRKLDFDLDRDLNMRLTGVRFRERGVSFRDKGVEFRKGSISLESKVLKERGKWADQKQWKRKIYKRMKPSTTRETSRLRQEKAHRRATTPSATTYSKPSISMKPPSGQPTHWQGVQTPPPPKKDDAIPVTPGEVQMVQSNKKNAIRLNNIGIQHYNKGDYHRALTFFNEAVRYDPYLDVATRNRDLCYQLVARGYGGQGAAQQTAGSGYPGTGYVY